MGGGKLQHESECWDLGYTCVAGVDEVGMGCLAGPVVAAAVIFSKGTEIPKGIDDSKVLSAKRRNELDVFIRESALAVSIAWAGVDEIDSINIYQAARLAMKRAVEKLDPLPDFLLIDGRAKVDLKVSQKSLIKGDSLSVSIGAASIVAKVYRDKWMCALDEKFPGYAFAKHKGYGSREHRLALQALGPTPLHRKSFSWTPV